MPGRIYSVGYEGLAVRALIDALTSANVSLLVDVRLNAVSRRPGWSKKSLQAELASAGIEYRHEPALGNPADNREAIRRPGGDQARRRMRELLGNGSAPALLRLADDARSGSVAVLCVERDARRCHRQVITDMVRDLDATIEVLEDP